MFSEKRDINELFLSLSPPVTSSKPQAPMPFLYNLNLLFRKQTMCIENYGNGRRQNRKGISKQHPPWTQAKPRSRAGRMRMCLRILRAGGGPWCPEPRILNLMSKVSPAAVLSLFWDELMRGRRFFEEGFLSIQVTRGTRANGTYIT